MIRPIGKYKMRCRFTCPRCNSRLESDDFDNDVQYDNINGEITYRCPCCKKEVTVSYIKYDLNFESEEYIVRR